MIYLESGDVVMPFEIWQGQQSESSGYCWFISDQ